MNSISLDYSLCIKVGQTFLNLFIAGNRVIVCSEAFSVRSDVYFFVQDSPILFQWSVAALFQYTFVLTLTAKFKFIRGDFIATVSLTTERKHLATSELFFEEARLSLIMLSAFYTICSGEIIATASAVKLSTQSFDRNFCHSALISGLIQSSSSFWARTRYSEPVSISNFSNLVTSQNFLKKL